MSYSRSLPPLNCASQTMNSASTASRISTTAPTSTWFDRVSIRASCPRLRPFGAGDRGATARSLEIFLYPRVIQCEQFVDRADRDHALVGEHRDPIADRVERIQIVRDQENGEPQRLLQRIGQIV